MPVIVRIAPSPTGYMHIGTARTALFNFYFAKRHGGQFLLRIEDTDRERSTDGAVEAIINGMRWLGLEWDGKPIFQFARADRHAEIAHELVKKGAAYYCYMTQEEMSDARQKAENEGHMWHYDRRWRDSTATATPPAGVKPSIRIKAPIVEGTLTLNDVAQGDIRIDHKQLDDFILLRSDGTPTYMLAVVVDDHDMGITHVVRGDDHLNNMFRQYLIYQSMGWNFPIHAHIPLIHGSDGKKLSKRRGAASIEEFRDMGYLPEALRNYLLRLGWGHGDDEIISDAQATEWFSLEHIGQSPAMLDFDKLAATNHHYIKLKENNELLDLAKPFIEKKYGTLSQDDYDRIGRGFNGLKERSKTLIEIANNCSIYLDQAPITQDETAKEKLAQPHAHNVIDASLSLLSNEDLLNGKEFIQNILDKTGLKMGQVAPVLRAALTGTMQSPELAEVLSALGTTIIRKRLQNGLLDQ
jgi:glutamyl-tRNA synthetase